MKKKVDLFMWAHSVAQFECNICSSIAESTVQLVTRLKLLVAIDKRFNDSFDPIYIKHSI